MTNSPPSPTQPQPPAADPGFTARHTTGELLIIFVGVTVCGYVVVTGTVVAILQATGRDVSGSAQNLADIINTLIGVLAGFLAGRTDTAAIKSGITPTSPVPPPPTPSPSPPSEQQHQLAQPYPYQSPYQSPHPYQSPPHQPPSPDRPFGGT